MIKTIIKNRQGEPKGDLPLFFRSQKFLSAKYKKTQTIYISSLLLYSLSSSAIALEKDDKAVFNIPRQRADLSLINFAEQANITLLFPIDKIKDKKTNAVYGEHTVIDALNHLLKNTGLKTDINDSGQLSILLDPDFTGSSNRINDKSKTPNTLMSILNAIFSHQSNTKKTISNTDKYETEVIEIKGIRGALSRAIISKKEASGVVDSISAEDIGKFSDTNLAESLQRISGVSIDRSGGEGQLITVRGFGPQFNTVLVNGRQIASENQSRAFSFDTIAAELVRSLDVHKTSTATTQSGGIGSTVNIKTARPFDIGGFKVAGSVKAVYDENSKQSTPQFSGLFSNTYNNDSLGLLLVVSQQDRETRLNQAQVDGWLENVGIPNPQTKDGQNYTGNIFSPRNYDHKVTTEERTRTNVNLVLQYAPLNNIIFTADALYSDFDVKANTTSYGHWFTAPNVEGFADAEGATVDENGTVIDLYQEVGLATDMHAKKFDRLTDTTALGLNVDWDINDNLNMTFDFSHSKAEREANNGRGDQLSLIGYANRVRFQVDENILPYASNFTSANNNIYSGQQELDNVAYDPNVTPAGVSNYLDPNNSRVHVMLRRGWAVEDSVNQFRWNNIWLQDDNESLTAIKFGAMFSSESKKLDRWDNEGSAIHCTFCGYPDEPSLSGFSQYVFNAGESFLSNISGSGRMPTSWLAHDDEANFEFLEAYAATQGNNISFDAVKRNKSFEITEETLSLYLELDFETELAGMPLFTTAGFRYESTKVDVEGTDEPIVALTILDRTEMLAQFGDTENIIKNSNYKHLLPNLNLKLEIKDDLIARFAASQSLTRPTLNSMSPVTVIDTTRQGGNLTSTSGNPELVPFTSDNLDLSLEWYYSNASYLSIGYFRKDVANFIVNSQESLTFELPNGELLTDPSTGNDVDNPDVDDSTAIFTNTLSNNSETAIVNGWEIAIQHTFNSGFGIMANATIVDSDAELDAEDITQVFALTGLSDSLNVVAFYEKGPLQTRLAWNWRDEFVQSLTQSNGDGVTIVEKYAQLDFSSSYDITDNISIFLEGINLTEEYVHKRGRFNNQLLLVEDSGRRFSLGFRGSF